MHLFPKHEHSRIRWEAIMRGTWAFPAAVGRMAFKACGLGADGRIAPGMFWKSGQKGEIFLDPLMFMVTSRNHTPKFMVSGT